MEDEWEEEEQLVVVELSGIIDNDCVSKCQGTCRILDIDSERPMMQVGQYVFAGEYEDAVGTCVLFEEEPQKEEPDSGPDLKYTCHTVKKLLMQRIFLTEKKEGETSAGNGEQKQKTITSESNQEENTNQEKEFAEDMDKTDYRDSAVD